MGALFVDENSARISIDAGRCVVTYNDGMKKMIPIESLESITILGQAQMTTQCVQECMKNGISVAYFSKGGSYFGRLQSTGHIKPERQRKQCNIYGTEFALEIAKNMIHGKLHNQNVLMRRYAKSKGVDIDDLTKMMLICRDKIDICTSTTEVMGYEGQAAKAYFEGLSRAVEDDFRFHGRSRRPPLDEFNSMVSLGYSVLMNEIYGKIEERGMNPYFGVLHSDREKHPTLASDLMEEWRAVIVDSTVMSLINGHEINKEHFLKDIDEPGCYLTKAGIKIFLNKLEKKLQTEVRYLDYVDYAVSFRRAISLQVNQLLLAIESMDPKMYKPILIR